MKKLLQVVGLALAWTAYGQGISTNQALNVTGFGTGGAIGINLMGWSFTNTVGIGIIEMGVFSDYLDGQMPVFVGLWAKDTGTLLGSVEVDAKNPAEQVTYKPVNEISLAPFQVCYIGAYSANPSGINVSIMDNNPSGYGGTFTASYGIQLGTLLTNNVFGTPSEVPGADGVVAVGANFRYRVPEPSAILLSCLAAFALLALRSRKQS